MWNFILDVDPWELEIQSKRPTSNVLSKSKENRCSDLFSEGYCVERAPVVANGLVPEHPLLPDLEEEPRVQIWHLAENMDHY